MPGPEKTSERTSKIFGPGALLTPANLITLGRLALAPVFIAMVLSSGPSWPALVLWIVLALSDWADGLLARRQGVTRSGAFLDPLADKVTVLGAMIALVIEHSFWWFPVLIISLRELAISIYRTFVGLKGVSMPARPLAKAKTVVQEVAVGFAVLPPTAKHARWVAVVFLWAAVALTVVSGLQYFKDAYSANRSLRK